MAEGGGKAFGLFLRKGGEFVGGFLLFTAIALLLHEEGVHFSSLEREDVEL
jgi:hypothetical protein